MDDVPVTTEGRPNRRVLLIIGTVGIVVAAAAFFVASAVSRAAEAQRVQGYWSAARLDVSKGNYTQAVRSLAQIPPSDSSYATGKRDAVLLVQAGQYRILNEAAHSAQQSLDGELSAFWSDYNAATGHLNTAWTSYQSGAVDATDLTAAQPDVSGTSTYVSQIAAEVQGMAGIYGAASANHQSLNLGTVQADGEKVYQGVNTLSSNLGDEATNLQSTPWTYESAIINDISQDNKLITTVEQDQSQLDNALTQFESEATTLQQKSLTSAGF